jgi:hypothetical protein
MRVFTSFEYLKLDSKLVQMKKLVKDWKSVLFYLIFKKSGTQASQKGRVSNDTSYSFMSENSPNNK